MSSPKTQNANLSIKKNPNSPKKETNVKNQKSQEKEILSMFQKSEVRNLSQLIGIDPENDSPKYLWFLSQALASELPYGWAKEIDINGVVNYHNSVTNVTTTTHPNAYKYRGTFHQLVNEDLLKGKKNEGLEKTERLAQLFQSAMKLPPDSQDQKVAIKKLKNSLQKEENENAQAYAKQMYASKIIKKLRQREEGSIMKEQLKFLMKQDPN